MDDKKLIGEIDRKLISIGTSVNDLALRIIEPDDEYTEPDESWNFVCFLDAMKALVNFSDALNKLRHIVVIQPKL